MAHTLCFTFALLALYPDEQEKLFEHIQSVTQGRVPVCPTRFPLHRAGFHLNYIDL